MGYSRADVELEFSTVEIMVKTVFRYAFLVLLAFGIASCTSVEYWDKGHLADPVMSFQDGATQAHFDQKVFQSIEAAAGGFGASAGGGCGCN
jgi:N-methylhydantoinase B/oxoprolinase/acetone carboxylase alpha subunit